MRYETKQLILSSILLFANGYGMIRSYNDTVAWGYNNFYHIFTIIFAVLFGISIMLCVIWMLILIEVDNDERV